MKRFGTLLFLIALCAGVVSMQAETKTVKYMPKKYVDANSTLQLFNLGLNASKAAVAPKTPITPLQALNLTDEGKVINENNTNNTSIMDVQPRGVVMGSAWYDVQTTGAMPTRVGTYQSNGDKYVCFAYKGSAAGTAAATSFKQSSSNSSWGTSLRTYFQNFKVNGSNLTPVTSAMPLETVKAAAGSLVTGTDGSIYASSYTFPLSLSKSAWLAQSTDASNFTVDTIKSNYAFLNKMAGDQDKLHMIYRNSIPKDPNYGELAYASSADKGKTWSSPVYITGANAVINATSTLEMVDSYAIDANGDNVVVTWVDKELNQLYRQSLDGGITWDSSKVVVSAGFSTLHLDEFNENGYTDTIPAPGACCDVLIDDNNNLHFATNVVGAALVGKVQENDEGDYEFVEGQDSVVCPGTYWLYYGHIYREIFNDGTIQKPELVGPQSVSTFTNDGLHAYLPFQYTYTAPNDSACGAFTTADTKLSMDQDGNIYLIFTGIVDSVSYSGDADAGSVTINNNQYSFYNRHIMAHKLDIQSGEWDPNVINLTPMGWDCAFPSVAKHALSINGLVYFPMTYIAKQEPLPWIDWYNTSLTKEPKAYATLMPFVAEPWNTSVKSSDVNTTQSMVYPNPAVEKATLNFNVVNAGMVKIDIYNSLGVQVANINNSFVDAGNRAIDFNVNQFTTGAYYARINSNGTTVTVPFTVAK